MMNPKGTQAPGTQDQSARIIKTTLKEDQRTKTNDAVIKEKAEIPEAFKQELTCVYATYVPMKNEFVSSDSKKIKDQALVVKDQLKDVKMELLSGEAHMEWMTYLNQLNEAVDKIITGATIEIQREGFADFNLAFYKTLKRFGLSDSTVYYQYCPMAFNSKGAYWFSEKKNIENPYFGQAMLKCGETRETFDYKQKAN